MPEYYIHPGKSVMIGVDLQKAFGEAVPVPDAPAAVENAKLALNHYRQWALGAAVLTRHVYTEPAEVGRLKDFIPNIYEVLCEDSPLTQLYDGVHHDGDIVIDKTRYNALHGRQLARPRFIDRMRGKLDTAIVCGLTTPICVESTVRELMMRDFKVILLEDACASQQLGSLSPRQAHEAAVQTMGALFAEPISTAEFISRTR
jgi:nicotinamidase-related amidase